MKAKDLLKLLHDNPELTLTATEYNGCLHTTRKVIPVFYNVGDIFNSEAISDELKTFVKNKKYLKPLFISKILNIDSKIPITNKIVMGIFFLIFIY